MGAAAVFSIAKKGRGYAVLCDGIEVAWRKDRFNAQTRRQILEAEARIRARPCLRCGTAFLSEGPHNRMCNDCRKLAATMFGGAA